MEIFIYKSIHQIKESFFKNFSIICLNTLKEEREAFILKENLVTTSRCISTFMLLSSNTCASNKYKKNQAIPISMNCYQEKLTLEAKT